MKNQDKMWRSLEELAATPEFEEMLHREFPRAASEWTSELHRRDFLRLMGASVALAGLGACTRQPIEKIVPYVDRPEEVIPGKPLYFATATDYCGYGQGIVVTSNEGRPTKIEGNPSHPASLGATTIWAQADVLDLYDPDRAKTITSDQSVSTWGVFLDRLNRALSAQAPAGGGLRFLTRTVTSPTMAAQFQAIGQKFPGARWHQWDALTHDAVRESRAGGAFGGQTLYDFSKAKVIVALDSDFLYLGPAALRHTRDFAKRRRVEKVEGASMSRFYAAEPTPSITGSNADHRLAVAGHQIHSLAAALAALIGTGGAATDVPREASAWLWSAAQDLRANAGASIVIAGETQPPEVHTLVAQINQSLGNLGATVTHVAPVEANPVNQLQSLRTLVDEMRSGAVQFLVILGGNPAYDTPVDLDFAGALQKVQLRVHQSLFANETSQLCHWQIPALHFLEEWSDLRAYDGTVSIVQPLVEPLYEGISTHRLLDAFIQQSPRSAYELVRATWRQGSEGEAFEQKWRKVLSDGATPGVGGEPAAAAANAASPAAPAGRPAPPSARQTLEILFRPDPNMLDGRYTNNGWLQELPKPFSKITWDNAALVSPALAQREKLSNGDYIELSFRGRKLGAPIWIMPGQAENSVTLHLGYGRMQAGRVGTNKGYNAYQLRTADALWQGAGLRIRKLDRQIKFATTQNHFTIEGRDMYRAGTLAEFMREPHFVDEMGEVPREEETLYYPDEYKNPGYAWGMVVDLNTCIGCNACTIACQAENNIPIVGKAQVIAGREMHWIRVDTYYAGAPDDPAFHHQPVPCMHCEHAPCELVCPVAATMHDDEGLNVQVYNRCVGTRYCSNNCPYKVRRFNFLEYNGDYTPSQKLVKNPDVTVRSRGVMEKCTYCLQRINAARITAELAHRKIRDGEITPACAQVCPAEAITFGDIHDPKSRVSRAKQHPLDYGMLAELNTRPRTSYRAKLRNSSAQLQS